jgi:hypothetical protein
MTRWGGLLLAVLVVVFSTSAVSEAQLDVAKVLVGKWDGDVQMASGTYPRTLVIKSVESDGGGLLAVAEYGGTGSGYAGAAGGYTAPDVRVLPVAINVQSFGNDVLLRFPTIEGWTVDLTLYKDQHHLFGNVRIPVSRGGAWPINPVRLTKVE